MKYTTGLPTPKFADLLIRLREEGVERSSMPLVAPNGHPPARGGSRGLSAEPGAEGLPEGGSDLHAP